MSIETQAFRATERELSILSGQGSLIPEAVVPEAVIAPEQASNLVAWVEANQEDAQAIGEALQDEEYAGIFTILATDKALCAQMLPTIMNIMEQKLLPEVEPSTPIAVSAPVAEVTEPITPTLPNRWAALREKVSSTYADLDAGLAEETEAAPQVVGRSWGQKTWAEVEQQVANDPRKRIMFANRPELRIVLTEPSRFETFMATSKTVDLVGKIVERPLAALETKSKQLDVFLDDSRPLQDIALDTAAIIGNKAIDTAMALMKYDDKLIAATLKLIIALDLPEKYAQARKYENELTDAIADKIITTVAEYDYRATYETVRETLKPTSKQTRAILVAGAAMSLFAVIGSGVDTTEKTVPVQEDAVEVVTPQPATAANVTPDKSVVKQIPTSFRVPLELFNQTTK